MFPWHSSSLLSSVHFLFSVHVSRAVSVLRHRSGETETVTFPARVTAVINYCTLVVQVCSRVSFTARPSPSTPTMNLNLIPKHSPSITSGRSTRPHIHTSPGTGGEERGERKGLELIFPQELPEGITAHSREFGGNKGKKRLSVGETQVKATCMEVEKKE